MRCDGGVLGSRDVFFSRYFNDFEISDDKVIKKSKNKRKIYSEYNYYRLLPEVLKNYMVEPYDYKEDGSVSQYVMRRVKVPDFSKRWVAGEVSVGEFTDLMETVFDFLRLRPRKKIDEAEYKKQADRIYDEKLKSRIETFRREIEDKEFVGGIKKGDVERKLSEVLSRYRRLYVRESMAGDDSVISHGDLCFSNMFFGDERGKLLLIDPRGAENENELWMDPYYDVAKLSHSVLGGYDFFNAGLYDVSPELDLGLKLGEDKRRYMEIFQDYLEKNNYEQRRVRLCEASLFLSMLPMHVDDLKKTVGFILNADKILAEVENV